MAVAPAQLDNAAKQMLRKLPPLRRLLQNKANRLKYGIMDKEPLTRDIQRMYPAVYDLARRAIKEIDTKVLGRSPRTSWHTCVSILPATSTEKFVSQGDAAATEEVLIIGAGNMASPPLW